MLFRSIGYRAGHSNGSGIFAGSIDEVRYAASVRDANWITTEYNNQNAPGDFYTVSPEQANFTVPSWDLNGDHVCNIGDVVKIGLCWGQTGSPGWIPEDVNNDGIIDIGDVVVIGLHWGQTW